MESLSIGIPTVIINHVAYLPITETADKGQAVILTRADGQVIIVLCELFIKQQVTRNVKISRLPVLPLEVQVI